MPVQQPSFDLGEPRQNDLSFPVTLAERYQPRVENFVGLAESKRVFGALLKNPRPCSILCIGLAGTGKSVMGMSFAEQLPGALRHIRAQSCDVDSLQGVWDSCQYSPSKGKFHVVLGDEADGMTEKAQLQWLSYGDGTAGLMPLWGGGFQRGQAPAIIWIWTCNGLGPDGTTPPVGLAKRFISRQTYILKFTPPRPAEMASYLKAIWEREKGPKGYPVEYFAHVAQGVGMRDALNRLDSELLAPRSLREVQAMLREKEEQDPELTKYNLLHPEMQERARYIEKRINSGKATATERTQLRTYKSWQKRYENDAARRMKA